MTCPRCSKNTTSVKASRGPAAAGTHIPAGVLALIEEDLGFITPHWYARHRVCQCGHLWWTLEASVADIARLASLESS
jgi:hypothetical protein|tara:strand:+ start:1162 stop:1395 length:234 start_codon:yes stop_codon:yes gene_type:complete